MGRHKRLEEKLSGGRACGLLVTSTPDHCDCRAIPSLMTAVGKQSHSHGWVKRKIGISVSHEHLRWIMPV